MVFRTILVVLVCAVGSGAKGEEKKVLHEWRFGGEAGWSGWHPNRQILDIETHEDHIRFRTEGSDPQVLSPHFGLSEAGNKQWVEVDLVCPEGGQAELYYTNKLEGGYGGLEPHWRLDFQIPPSKTLQTVTIWPFWKTLGKILLMRLDPPDGANVRLYAVRIVEVDSGTSRGSEWNFEKDDAGWISFHAAKIHHEEGALRVHALSPQAVIISPVSPFDASRRSILRIDGEYSGDEPAMLYWVTEEHTGLNGRPLPLPAGGTEIDLRQFDIWEGTITHLAFGFGSLGNETLRLRQISIGENDPSVPHLRPLFMGFDRAINRPGETGTLRIVLQHSAGPAFPETIATIEGSENLRLLESSVRVPAIAADGKSEIRVPVHFLSGGTALIEVTVGTQTFKKELRIDLPVKFEYDGEYPVPPPRPVKTDYEIGVYYFPGWSRDQMNRWVHQATFPELDPVLGWYREGDPEVADWHVKWALENGVSFFVYDWYWRNGREELTKGLNEGLLKSRYGEMMKFALMWANHPPFSNHTLEQLLEVTDYWIENYFHRPNYLRIDGKPYVSFFTPGELIGNLGGEEKVLEAFTAMEERARAAGLPGIHFGACGGTDRNTLEIHRRCGYDSVTAYNYVTIDTVAPQSIYRHYMLAHEGIWRKIREARVIPYIPLLTINWDSRPWHGSRAYARLHRRTTDFREGLERLKAYLDETGDRMAILEAWNEWGEGAFLEPNRWKGFGDPEAIREVFAGPGPFPENIAPTDQGMFADAYDMRPFQYSAEYTPGQYGSIVYTQGIHPAVERGFEIVCNGSEIEVRPGTARDERGLWRFSGSRVPIEPAEVKEVRDARITLVSGVIESWRGGNRLRIPAPDGRTLLPRSYVPESLILFTKDGSEPVPSTDYQTDAIWGAFSLAEGGTLSEGSEARISYRYSLRRIDALVLEPGRTLRVIKGLPEVDCPEPPEIPDNVLHLANLYRPYRSSEILPHHVYIPMNPIPDPAPDAAPGLEPVLQKLRGGGKVTIVCWGDSVTVGGDASSSEKSFVGLLESGLRERFPNASLRVINAGIGGSTTRGRHSAFEEEVLEHNPDVVVLEFVNDMGLPVEELETRYRDILNRIRSRGAELILVTPHFVMPEWMGLSVPRGQDPRPGVAFLRKFASQHNVPLADAARRWERLESHGIPYETLLKNGINHPDDRGHRIFAEELFNIFQSEDSISRE